MIGKLIALSLHEIGVSTECRQIVGVGSHSSDLHRADNGFLPGLHCCFEELWLWQDALQLCHCYGCKLVMPRSQKSAHNLRSSETQIHFRSLLLSHLHKH